MKKLLLTSFIMTTPSLTFTETRFNQVTGIYSSYGAKKEVNQVEYHNLVIEANRIFVQPYGITRLPADRLVALFGWLRAINTPASLRLVVDIEMSLKDAANDLRRLNKL